MHTRFPFMKPRKTSCYRKSPLLLSTCSILHIHNILCSNKDYKKYKIVGYKNIDNIIYNTINTKIESLDTPFSIINHSCNEITVLYIYLYSPSRTNIFRIEYSPCTIIKLKSINKDEILVIEFTLESKREFHFNNNFEIDFNNNFKIGNKEIHNLENKETCEIQYDLKNQNFLFIKRKCKKNESENVEVSHSDLLGSLFCKGITYNKEIMIKWNTLRIYNKEPIIDLIIRFLKENKDYLKNMKLEFIYLFYHKRLINREEFIKILNLNLID